MSRRLTRYLPRLIGVGLSLLFVVLPAVAYASEEGGEDAHKGLVDPNSLAFIYTLIVFALVVVVLWKVAWGPLLKALDDRDQRIRDSLEAADRAREESQQAAAEHEKLMAAARKEATELVEEGKRDATVVKNQIIEDAKKSAGDIRDRTLAEIERAKTNAVYEIHDRAVELSYEIAEKLISKSLDKGEHDALVKETIQRYDRMEGTQS